MPWVCSCRKGSIGSCFFEWGVPLAAMKPQLAAFALLAKKKSMIAGVVWGLLSLAHGKRSGRLYLAGNILR